MSFHSCVKPETAAFEIASHESTSCLPASTNMPTTTTMSPTSAIAAEAMRGRNVCFVSSLTNGCSIEARRIATSTLINRVDTIPRPLKMSQSAPITTMKRQLHDAARRRPMGSSSTSRGSVRLCSLRPVGLSTGRFTRLGICICTPRGGVRRSRQPRRKVHSVSYRTAHPVPSQK